MEALVRRIEDLAGSLAGPAAAAADAALSPAMRLAAMLKEALAANTIGGKVDDDSRWRAAAEDVRQAQASLVAHRPGARADAPRARRSLPAREPAHHGSAPERERARHQSLAERAGRQVAAVVRVDAVRPIRLS